MSMSGVSAVLVAWAELAAVRAVTGAIARPVRVVRDPGSIGFGVRVEPKVRFEPRQVITPEPRIEPRRVIKDTVEVRTETVAAAPVTPEPVRKPSKLTKLPETHRYETSGGVAASKWVKVVINRVDSYHKGGLIDVFC
jgi:hypothetical protein